LYLYLYYIEINKLKVYKSNEQKYLPFIVTYFFFYNSKKFIRMEGSTRCTKNQTAQGQKNKNRKTKESYIALIQMFGSCSHFQDVCLISSTTPITSEVPFSNTIRFRCFQITQITELQSKSALDSSFYYRPQQNNARERSGNEEGRSLIPTTQKPSPKSEQQKYSK
jgi:hypothetical protein